MPKRIQRRRTRGWRMPENAISVTRPGKWSNPFTVAESGTAEVAVYKFRKRLEHILATDPDYLEPLRGHDLACWCKENDPCHADVLLSLANDPNPARAGSGGE